MQVGGNQASRDVTTSGLPLLRLRRKQHIKDHPLEARLQLLVVEVLHHLVLVSLATTHNGIVEGAREAPKQSLRRKIVGNLMHDS
jgi:hypothetical protein